ncbi:MAG: hypothetical protein ABI832_21230 [bacterium]
MINLVFNAKRAASSVELPFDDGRVVAALQDALSAARFTTDPPPELELIKLLVAVSRAFFRAGQYGDAQRVILAAPFPIRTRYPMRLMLVKIYSRLSCTEELIAEFRDLMQRPNPILIRDQFLSSEASRLGVGWRLADCARLKPALSGPLPADPVAWLEHGDGEWLTEKPNAAVAASSPKFAQIARLMTMDPADVATRMLAQSDIVARGIYLYRAAEIARVSPPGTPGAAEMIAFYERFLRENLSIDVGPLEAEMARGRNCILLMAHSGSSFRFEAFSRLPGTKCMVSNRDFVIPGISWSPVAADSANRTLNFLKFARTLRKTPQLVIILPDGMQGGARGETVVNGNRFQIGLGGAALARVAPSTLFFAHTVQQGHKVIVEVTKGPEDGPGTDPEISDQTFLDFVGQGIARILSTTPEDIMAFGFLNSLITEEEEGEPPWDS